MLAAGALAPAAVTTATAVAEMPAAGRACFYPQEVRGFTQALDNTAVNLRVGAKDVYQLTLQRECVDLKWQRAIQVTGMGGGTRVCDGPGIEIITSVDSCPVSHMRKLSPEEVAALPVKDRP